MSEALQELGAYLELKRQDAVIATEVAFGELNVTVQLAHLESFVEFLRDDAPQLEPVPESDRAILRMPVGSDHIAAPTAALLYQFREVCLLGRATRVAHFEQPAFAWR